MTYVDAALGAVPTTNRERYLAHAETAAALFKRHGALEVSECWGVDVPDGAVNSMNTAVLRKPDETVVFSWILWPSKAVRDDAWEQISKDPEMTGMEMPFDGQRMIFGGFETILHR